MNQVAEKLVESATKFDQVSRQLDLLSSKLPPDSERSLLTAIIDHIVSNDNVIKPFNYDKYIHTLNNYCPQPISLRNVLLLDKACLRLIKSSESQTEAAPANPLPEDRISFRKTEFEVNIIWMKCELLRMAGQPSHMKQAESIVKARLYKYLNTADHSTVWATQYLQAFFYSKEKQLVQSFVPDNKVIAALNLQTFVYDDNLSRIRFLFEFRQANKQIFPLTIDFTEILIRWLLSIRGTADDEIELGKRILQEIYFIQQQQSSSTSAINAASSSSPLPIRAFAVCLEMLKFDYPNEPTNMFDPRKMCQIVLTGLSAEVLRSLALAILPGMVYANSECWFYLFRNLLRMTTTEEISALLIAISEHMITFKIFTPLTKILDSLIVGLYLGLALEKTRTGSLRLLRLFLLGSSPEIKLFAKHEMRIQKCLQDITCTPIFTQIFQLGQCLLKKYENSNANTEIFKVFLEEFYTQHHHQSTGLLPLTADEIDKTLVQYNWVEYKKNMMEVEESKQNVDQQTTQSQLLIEAPNAKTLRGLWNLGNTCYMNSYVQALYMTKEFRYRVLKINLAEVMRGGGEAATPPSNSSSEVEKTKKFMKVATVFQLQKLFALLFKSKRKYLNPNFFKSILPDFFRLSFAQQDASEFGRIFLDQLEHSVQDTNDKKLLDDYFIGCYEHCITCLQCQSQFKRPEKFLDISLSFGHEQAKTSNNAMVDEQSNNKSTDDLSDLVSRNFQSEMFEGDNKYECSTCQSKQSAKKETTVSHLPNYVILTLNRFQYDIKTFKKIKLLDPIQVLEEIDLSLCLPGISTLPQQSTVVVDNDKMMIDENQPPTQQQEDEEVNLTQLSQKLEEIQQNQSTSQIYQLYAMVVHRGSTAESGHYFTYARDSCTQDCRWMLFDDSNVSEEANLAKILASFQGTTSSPYLLFYQRKQHVLDYNQEFSESAFKISDKLIYSIEKDDREMLQEMEKSSNVFSLLNQIKINHSSTQIHTQNYPFGSHNNDHQGGSSGGATGGGGFMHQGGFGPGGTGGGGIC